MSDDEEVADPWEVFKELSNDRFLPNLVEQGRMTEEEANDIRAALSDFRTEEDVDRALEYAFDAVVQASEEEED